MSTVAVVLCLVYAVYLNLGALVFMYLEWETEEVEVSVEREEWKSLKEMISSPSPPEDEEKLSYLVTWLFHRCTALPTNLSLLITTTGDQSGMLDGISSTCPLSSLTTAGTELRTVYPWSFIDALYFSMTVATTIGYGHICPSTASARIACMIYALTGIPLTMMLLSMTSTFFGERLFMLFKSKLDKEKHTSQLFIALGTVFYVIVGLVVFIFVPSVVFMSIEEDWSYLDAVYYAFVTLTTIGFGDFVTASALDGVPRYAYQIGVILWIMAGLGYWVMVANFIIRALRSKEMQRFAKNATDIKKLMNQVGITHQDPHFMCKNSKASMNFLMQLSSTLIIPEHGAQTTDSGTAAPNSGAPATPPAIPGIASLFGRSGLGGMMPSMLHEVKQEEEARAGEGINKTAARDSNRSVPTQPRNGSTPLGHISVNADIEPSTRKPIPPPRYESRLTVDTKQNHSPPNATEPATETSSVGTSTDTTISPMSEAVDLLKGDLVVGYSEAGVTLGGPKEAVRKKGDKGSSKYSPSKATKYCIQEDADDMTECFSIRL